MNFIPQNYEAPASGGKYTKIKEGDTRLRILGEAIAWWYSRDDSIEKPVMTETKHSKVGRNDPVYFLAFPVWNYKEEKVQIYQVNSKVIQKALVDLASNEDWGNPNEYDITIKRVGTSKEDTKYSVMPAPKKPLETKIEEEFKKTKIDLRELFRGGNPFEPTDNVDDDLPF